MLLAARLSRLGVCMVGALNSFSPARASMFGLRTKRFWVFNINLLHFTWSHQQLSKEHFCKHWHRRNCSGRQRKAMITFSVANRICCQLWGVFRNNTFYTILYALRTRKTFCQYIYCQHDLNTWSEGRMIIETTTPLLSATIQLLSCYWWNTYVICNSKIHICHKSSIIPRNNCFDHNTINTCHMQSISS